MCINLGLDSQEHCKPESLNQTPYSFPEIHSFFPKPWLRNNVVETQIDSE